MSYFAREKNMTLEQVMKMETVSFETIRDTVTSRVIEYKKAIDGLSFIIARIQHTEREDFLLFADLHWYL